MFRKSNIFNLTKNLKLGICFICLKPGQAFLSFQLLIKKNQILTIYYLTQTVKKNTFEPKIWSTIYYLEQNDNKNPFLLPEIWSTNWYSTHIVKKITNESNICHKIMKTPFSHTKC